MSLVRATVAAIVVGLVPVAALADPIGITQDRRVLSLEGGANLAGTHIGDAAGAFHTYTDNMSDSIAVTAGPIHGSASASLVSSIADPSRLSGSARSTLNAVYPGPLVNGSNIGVNTDANFDVVFRITEPYHYTFSSTFTSARDLGETGTDARTMYFAQLALTPGMPRVFSINAIDSQSFLETGILAPGEYWFVVQNQDLISGTVSANSAFDFTLNLDPGSPTPEPASLLLLGTAAAGFALRRRRA